MKERKGQKRKERRANNKKNRASIRPVCYSERDKNRKELKKKISLFTINS
jgi:hypothetical protein